MLKYKRENFKLVYCASREVCSYRWIFGATGEGNTTLFTTGITISTVEIDVHVPIICSKRTTALPLQSD